MVRMRMKKVAFALINIINIIAIIGVFTLLSSPIQNVKDRRRRRMRTTFHKNQPMSQLPRPNVTKEIAILGSTKQLDTWTELAPLLVCFQNGAEICYQYCAKQDTNITMSLVNKVADFRNKDAVVVGVSPFSLRGKIMEDLINYEPPSGQLVVFYSMESPVRVQKWLPDIGKLRYHINVTYMKDSHVSLPYAFYQPYHGKEEIMKSTEIKTNWGSNKTALVSWMGSNCNKEVFWPRMDYINRLSSYIKVDLYGKCGSLTCLPRLSHGCVNLLSTCKFYLAFENAECLDYMTEKLWITSLLNDVVPVVYGAPKSNVEKHAPPNSFIHVSDFESPKELAEYLQHLDENDDLYNQFFEWKHKGKITVNYPQLQPAQFCDLIEHLKRAEHYRDLKSVSESTWYNSCRNQIQMRSEHYEHKMAPKFKNWTPWIG